MPVLSCFDGATRTFSVTATFTLVSVTGPDFCSGRSSVREGGFVDNIPPRVNGSTLTMFSTFAQVDAVGPIDSSGRFDVSAGRASTTKRFVGQFRSIGPARGDGNAENVVFTETSISCNYEWRGTFVPLGVGLF